MRLSDTQLRPTEKALQVRLSKAQVGRHVHTDFDVRFESQRLTSFAGLFVFAGLFLRLCVSKRLRARFKESGRKGYGLETVFMLLVTHALMGCRSWRERDSYAHDPMVMRTLGVQRIPDVSTVSRRLRDVSAEQEQGARGLVGDVVTDRMLKLALRRATLDFDGSVNSTRRHAEGTAVGYNKRKKGARSYYPLFCTVSQTGQFLDCLHRSGNVHDSEGAFDFMRGCVLRVRGTVGCVVESRVDSAFFSQALLEQLDDLDVEFTASVPFERLLQLKDAVERVKRWHRIDDEWSYAESGYRPKSWSFSPRFVLYRRLVPKQRKGPLQLDLFEPRDHQYEFKVVATNKSASAAAVLKFHNGRGYQECLLGEAKKGAALEHVPSNRLIPNQLSMDAAMFAHNLARELQFEADDVATRTTPNRTPSERFETLSHLQRRIIRRAGVLTRPQGKLTLTISAADQQTREDLMNYARELARAA